jgi:hypothetical protein
MALAASYIFIAPLINAGQGLFMLDGSGAYVYN